MPGGRGGRRNGKPATAYKNRTDLNGGPSPVTTMKGQGYGVAGEQAAAQSAVPMGTPEIAMPTAESVAGAPRPGSMPGLFDDSVNPGEDYMSGAAMGPGPGPEAFGFGAANQTSRDIGYASRYLPAMEMAANGDKGSAAARQIVRMLKAHMGDEG